MDTAFVTDVLREALPAVAVTVSPTATDMPTLEVPHDHVLAVCQVLRDHPLLQFALIVDVTAVDLLPAEPRFQIVYHFASLGAAYATGEPVPARRLRMKTRLPAAHARVSSITPIYPAANWLEREVFDLFGVSFDGHPDLRRILMPDDWEGSPLRKDYPVQIRKDAASWEPVQISLEEFTANMRAQRERATKQATPE